MGIEDFSPDIDSSEGISGSPEASLEVSEKYKETSKKASAGIQRTQKDEKKAKRYDFILAGFLVKIILDKKYDFILEQLFKTTDTGYSSNFVLGILSLINTDISNKIRKHNNKNLINFSYKQNKNTDFDDNNMPIEVKNRINYWIEDIIDSVTIDYSSIQTNKIIRLLESDDINIINYTSDIFIFFLNEIDISITKSKANSISSFIISEVFKSLKKLRLEEI